LTEKIQLYRSIFRGRDDVYGSGNCIRKQLTDDIISDHLNGINRIGIYPLINKNQTLFIVVDIDKDIPLIAKDYYDRAKHYLLPTYIERSKSKGYHCWHFFTNPIEAKKARILIKEILSEIELNTEIFPKQDETDDVGNFIYLPLFNEGKEGRTVFVDPDNGFVPYPNQWEVLRNIKKIIPEQVDGIIELNDFHNKELQETDTPQSEKWIFQTLNSIHEGEGRNNACFKLSRYYLSKLPPDVAWQTMQIWNSKNIPPLNEKEFQNTFNSALKYQKDNHKQVEVKNSNPEKPAQKNPFPEINNDIFNEYMDILTEVTEAPKSYHFFSFAAIMGMLLGKNAFISYSRPLYPNMFVLLVGRSGLDRKDTAISFATDLLRSVTTDVQILPSISSYEGLLLAMGHNETELGIQHEITLVAMSEFDALLRKSRSESVSNLIPSLCNLYDCPNEARVITKTEPIRVINPFLSIVAGIQPDIVEEAFKAGDVHGGFAGRIMYILDTTDKNIPLPTKYDVNRWNSLISMLSHIKANNKKQREMKLSDNSISLWKDFYVWYRSNDQKIDLLNTLNARITNHVLKIAMLFAVSDDSSEISIIHLENAIEVGKWLIENNKNLFGGLGQSTNGRLETRIIDILGESPKTKRELRHRLGGRVTADILVKVIENLKKADVITEKQVKMSSGQVSKKLYLLAS
jgi:hypothetical protein